MSRPGLTLVAALLFTPIVRAAEEPFDYFQNSWSVIGLKDYLHGTRVTPENELLLANGRKVRLRFGEKLIALSRDQVKTNLRGWMPIIIVEAVDGSVRYKFTFWATPLPSIPDWKAAFDWPVAGENFMNWVKIETSSTASTEASAGWRIEIVDGSNIRGSTIGSVITPTAAGPERMLFRIPFDGGDIETCPQAEADLWLERTVKYWESVEQNAARIEVPCRKTNETLLAAHVCQLIANDHGEVHGGEGFYDEFYIRDGAYQVMELEEAGLTDAARTAVSKYLDKQLPDGRFESQKGQFDANGQAIWTLWQFYKITGDKEWLAKVYPQMRRAADWAIQARQQAAADSPFVGLLPNAVADGEYLWDGKHHIVGYDLWNLRGMLCTADAARNLGRIDEALVLTREADAYRAAIDAACKRTGVAHFPPCWENPKEGTHWGNTETLWPTPLFAADDPRVSATIDEDRHHHGGGFIEGTNRWTGFAGPNHPYMTAYTTMATLARGEHEQVVEDFYWYLLHSSATHAFPEGIFYQRRFAWSDTIPHVTGACNFAIILRHMLVHEELPIQESALAGIPSRGADALAGTLHLLSAIPDNWLADGRQIVVERAPTCFGKLSLTVRGEAKGVRVTFDKPTDRPFQRIILHLPKSRPSLEAIPGVEVATRADQKANWDYATVVDEYKRTAPPLAPASQPK